MIAPLLAQAATPAPNAGLLVDAFGHRPFVDPISVGPYWYLLMLPLLLLLCMGYKAIRLKTLEAFPRRVAIMTVQSVLAMIGLAAALYLLVQVYVPMFH